MRPTWRASPDLLKISVPAEPVWWDLQVVHPVAVPRQAANRGSPNVLLLVVDTLGARHTSLHGGARDIHLAVGKEFDDAVVTGGVRVVMQPLVELGTGSQRREKQKQTGQQDSRSCAGRVVLFQNCIHLFQVMGLFHSPQVSRFQYARKGKQRW